MTPRLPWVAAAISSLLLATATRLPAAGLQWDARLVQHEAKLGEDEVDLSFAFSNTSDRTITITAVETSCGCTAATLAKKSYAPGEKGQLAVTFDAKGASGVQQKTIQVTTDDTPEPTTLTLRVTVPTWLEIAPRLLWWKVGDKDSAKEATITLNEQAKIKITSVTSDNPAVQASLQSDAGGKYRLILKPGSTKEPVQAIVTVTAEAPGAAVRKYAVFAQVR